MDPYAHASCDELMSIIGELGEAIRKHPEKVAEVWQSVPARVRYCAGDFDAINDMPERN
jgi:hypothetical protein